MARGLDAQGVFNGDWDKLSGVGSTDNPLLYDGKRFSGTIKWSDTTINYANGVRIESKNKPSVGLETDANTPENPEGTTLTPEQKDAKAQLAGKVFGFMKSFLEKYPNDVKLQESWALLLENDIAGAELAFKESQYYQNTLPESDKRIKRKLNQFGVYSLELNNFIDEQVRRLTQSGIKLDPKDPKVRAMFETAYDNAETDNQIDIKALAFTNGKTLGGATGGSIADLRSYAKAFGIKYSDNDYARWSQEIFSGTTTAYDIQQKIRQDSASAFPIYSDKILNGESVDSIGSAYLSSYANILEVDPDSADWNDPLLRKAMQYTQDGKPAVMPVWMFEQELRKDPRWQYTNQARESVYNAVYSIGTDWGLI